MPVKSIQVAPQLFRDDIFIQLCIDGFFIELTGLNDAIDIPLNILLEYVFDFQSKKPLSLTLFGRLDAEGAVVVVIFKNVEQT